MDGSAYVRLDGPSEAIRGLLPDLSGSGGVRLRLNGAGTPIGPPAGSLRYAARWRTARTAGDATLLVVPINGWGSEVHLTLRAPRSPAALLWTRRRLSRAAADLAVAIRAAAEPLATWRGYNNRGTAPKRALLRTSTSPRATTTA